jgi:RNA polymerase sigma-70 factor, ECF subfamily
MAIIASTDIWLMLETKAGHREGFDVLVERHRNDLIGYLYRMVYDHAAAEDLAQEAFLRAYRSRGSYVPTAKFTTWLYSIATRLALNWLRDNRRFLYEPIDQADPDQRPRQIADPRPLADAQAIRSALLQALRSAVAQLPDRQRAVVIMHRYHDMTHEEIATALRCSPQSVRSMLHRARAALRARLLRAA